ncbi:MAG: hydroxymethylbilane synthase [Gemmatimonadetes bacterium]|nr:hydroxymethylbilane synthase [Gemmatimonadota bacterium]
MRTVRLGTRGSPLALAQAEWVRSQLATHEPDPDIEIVTIRTTGDRAGDTPIPSLGDRGVFTKEIDHALLNGEVDLAVHSLKDVPTEIAAGLRIVAVPPREDPRDALVGRQGTRITLASLPAGSRVGTSSLRRRALAHAWRPDLQIVEARGNVDTRLRRVDAGDYDAIILAAAGLRRLGHAARIGEYLETPSWLPAPGQGAIAVLARDDDGLFSRLGALLDDPGARAAVAAERALLHELEAGCQVPVGALSLPYPGGLRIWGLIASPDGRRVVRGDRTGVPANAATLGIELARMLLARGGDSVLEEVRALTPPAPDHP